MSYVLEWRSPGSAEQGAVRCVVSYMRVFRSLAALKAYLRSRRFTQNRVRELRFSVHKRQVSRSVFTTAPNILAWNPDQAGLPPPLVDCGWDADLARLGLRDRILASVAAELERARVGRLLSAEQVVHLQGLFAGSLSTR